MTQSSESAGALRVLGIAFAVTAAILVVLRFEPRIAAAQRSLADAELLLHSDTIAFADAPLLRSERSALRKELGALLSGPPEATFMRELARLARRHHVRVLSTSFERVQSRRIAQQSQLDARLEHQNGMLSLEGSYANLLEAISDLPRGDALLSVGAPSIQRSATSLVAQIPVTLSTLPRGSRR